MAKDKKPAKTPAKKTGAGPAKVAGKTKNAAKKSVKAAPEKAAARNTQTTKKTPAAKAPAKQPQKAPARSAAKSPVKKDTGNSQPTVAKTAARTPAKTAAKPNLEFLTHLDRKTLDQITQKLQELRDESLEVVNAHVQADLKQREDSKDVGDDMDQASNERDREFSLIIHQRHLRRLQQIDRAFERMEDGSYGLCEGTEEPINPRRLLIMPLARYSIEYQQQQEKMLGRSPETAFDGVDEQVMTDE